MTNDAALLARYGRERSEEAFAALVHRHLNLVYTAALRQVHSPQLAEEVSQSVFADLARNAGKLKADTVLTAWLYQVARRTGIDVVRRESRRQARERIAVEIAAMNATSDWNQIEPLLDEGMDSLEETDRTALLLRYFDNKSLREVGETLGTTDDAAQKRVSRAVERLREFFTKRGVAVGAGGLVAVISANAVQAAPAGMAVAISASAFTAASIGAATGAGALVHLSGVKALMVVGVAAVVGISAILLLRQPPNKTGFSTSLATTEKIAAESQQAVVSTNGNVSPGDEEHAPDPLSLLIRVALARERVTSGSMEFDVIHEEYSQPRKETSHLHLTALFDGPKLRFEQFDREYSYTYAYEDADQEDIKRRADKMDRPAAVKAGLLEPFESHHSTIYDGAVLMDYWETDGKPNNGAAIQDPRKGSGAYIFAPACLGLSINASMTDTIQGDLAFNGAKSITLVGKEDVLGTPAWHVHVQSKYDAPLDFWIEAAHPSRLLKSAYGSDMAMSQYDDTGLGEAIPTEVLLVRIRKGSIDYRQRFVRSKARFNIAIDPTNFTLAGLNLPVGTDVHDDRIMRRIGYWTGTGLSENLPRNKQGDNQPAPKLADLLDVLDKDPASAEGRDAAQWIILNNPDGPEVEKACDVILQDHIRDTNLLNLCQELNRVRPASTTNLLAGFLNDNPDAGIQATACFIWASLLKEQAKFGENQRAQSKAEELFERVITEFGEKGPIGAELGRKAKPELDELTRLGVGKPAPVTEGVDLNGQPMKLSDYRGNVVVLVFWSGDFSEAKDFRKLAETMTGKPFAVVGVNCDQDLDQAKTSVDKWGVTWPSFWDRRNGSISGPISSLWHVNSWVSTWVIDRQGVIRYRNIRWRELDDAVNRLLSE